jgi:1,2-diacylglycerol 3-alpha-glucosyltransferase
MKSPVNILILTPGFAADENDTTSVPSLQLFIRFLQSNYTDLTIRIAAIQYPVKSGNYTWHGLQAYSAGGRLRKFNRILTWLKVLVHLYRLRRKTGIDIVHTFWLTEATLIGLIFCRLTRTRLIATAMGQDVKAENKYLGILRFFKFDLTLLSHFQHEYVKTYKNTNVLAVVPFGVDLSYFKALPVIRDIEILGVGSLNQVKNYEEFVEVIQAIAINYPGIRCKIIGEGYKMPGIETVIKEKGLDKNITLAGNLSYTNTIEEMHRGRILLHTSTFEGQALVITEALAAGLYVVCHPVGIAAGLQSEKLMTGQDTDELVRHILSILEMRQPDHSPEIHYTIDDTCKEYYSIYQSILQEK